MKNELEITVTHREAVRLFCQYNGQRGTEKQIDRAIKSFPPSQAPILARLLNERRINVVLIVDGSPVTAQPSARFDSR